MDIEKKVDSLEKSFNDEMIELTKLRTELQFLIEYAHKNIHEIKGLLEIHNKLIDKNHDNIEKINILRNTEENIKKTKGTLIMRVIGGLVTAFLLFLCGEFAGFILKR